MNYQLQDGVDEEKRCMAFTLQIHIQVSDDVEKAVKRTKRQSQWTLLDPRTGRPVGQVTI